MNSASDTPRATGYYSRRARRLDDPAFEWWRTPRRRRFLIIAMVAILALEAAVFAVGSMSWIYFTALTVLVVAFVLCMGALKASTRGVEELPATHLDERQSHLRGLVYARAYRIGMCLLLAGVVTVGLWLMLDLPAPGSGVVIAALVISWQLPIVLPTLVAASLPQL